MRLFISWSGERSKSLAEVLRQWLPGVIQAVRPFYTPDDVAKGARWGAEIGAQLSETRVGLICLTRESLEAPWIMFEAGALSKTLDTSKVVPLLLGLEPTDLKGPLVQFQAARFESGDFRKVVKMINGELGDAKLAPDVLDSVFDMWWPRLEEKVKPIAAQSAPTKTSVRSERELLEEVLTLTRSVTRRSASSEIHPGALLDLIQGYSALVSELENSGIAGAFQEAITRIEKPVRYFVAKTARSQSPELQKAVSDLETTLETFRAGAAGGTVAEEDDDLPF